MSTKDSSGLQIRQGHLAGAVGVHQKYLLVSLPGRRKGNPTAVRGPGWQGVLHQVEGKALMAGAIGIHHIYLPVPFSDSG